MTRKELPSLIQISNPIVVEVGVASGEYASSYIEALPNASIYLVDLWSTEHVYAGLSPEAIAFLKRSGVCGLNNLDKCYRDLRSRYAGNVNVKLLRASSVEAATTFREETISWVYIDANHKYEHVKADIEAWWPKVIPGDILSGHDFNPDFNDEQFRYIPLECYGVERAVKEKFGAGYALTDEPFWKSWYVKK